MKRIVSILMMMVAMVTITASAFAQAPNQKQRISREQLAEKQAQHIAHDLAFDEKTTARFIDTYTACQKEIWALVFATIRKVLRPRVSRILSSVSRGVRRFSTSVRSITRSIRSF